MWCPGACTTVTWIMNHDSKTASWHSICNNFYKIKMHHWITSPTAVVFIFVFLCLFDRFWSKAARVWESQLKNYWLTNSENKIQILRSDFMICLNNRWILNFLILNYVFFCKQGLQLSLVMDRILSLNHQVLEVHGHEWFAGHWSRIIIESRPYRHTTSVVLANSLL